jgi:sensor histidine kinase regulating citrate/malate metabolism
MSGIVEMDLCVLLGNALDNAFTGCLTITENRNVTLIAQTEKETLSFVIKNTFDGEIKTKDKIILSRKRENSEGIGLKSMEAICEKYKGTMEIKYDEEHFVILIILTKDNNLN